MVSRPTYRFLILSQGWAAALVRTLVCTFPRAPDPVLGWNIVAHGTQAWGGSLHNSIQSSKGGDRASQDFSNSQGPGYGSKCHFYCSDNVVLEGGPKPG